MAMSQQDREYVEAVAELAAERAATKAVDKMASIVGKAMRDHKADCGARAVWLKVRTCMVLGILGGSGVAYLLAELMRYLLKGA